MRACSCSIPSTSPSSIATVPVTLFEVQELWWSSTDSTQPVELLEAEKTHETSSLAHSHKRARSVDTGRDTQQPDRHPNYPGHLVLITWMKLHSWTETSHHLLPMILLRKLTMAALQKEVLRRKAPEHPAVPIALPPGPTNHPVGPKNQVVAVRACLDLKV